MWIELNKGGYNMKEEPKEPEQTVTIPLDEYVWLKICEDRLFMQDEQGEDESPEISKMDGYVGTFKEPNAEPTRFSVSEEEFKRLTADSALLYYLRCAGVDDWEGYADAHNNYKMEGK
jgi:hypothetical protein